MPLIKHSLGVSIEEGSLRLAFVRSTWRGPRVVATASFDLPSSMEGEEGLAQDVQKFLLRRGLRLVDIITFGVPRSAMLFRHIATPPVKERDLPDLLGYEYDRHLPGGREDFLVGYQNLGRGEDGGYRLLIGAARRDMVENYLAVLRKAHLSPHSLRPGPVARAEAFRTLFPDVSSALLVSKGREAFTADLLQHGRLVTSRYFPLPDAGDVEGVLRGRDEAPVSTESFAETVSERLTEKLFLETLPDKSLPPVWIHGLESDEARTVQRLEHLLNAPVRVFSPLRQFAGEVAGTGGTGFGTALGLALLGLRGDGNGMEMSEERIEGQLERPRYKTTVVLAAACLALLVSYYGIQAVRNRQYLRQIDRQVEALRQEKTKVEELSRQVQQKRQSLDFLAGAVHGRIRQADLLKELTVLIPDDTYLSDYEFKGDRIQISGLSPSSSRLLSILEASPLFRGARFSSTIVSQGQSLERFKIRLEREEPGG